VAKFDSDAVLDGTLDIIAACTELYICSGAGAPADRAAAIAASGIAAHTLASGDFAKADDTSGRKVTLAAQAALSVTASITATHIALCTGSVLQAVTTCTSQALTSGNTVSTPAFKWGVADPT